MKNQTLNGFETIFDAFINPADDTDKQDGLLNIGGASESLTDEELEALVKGKTDTNEDDDDDDAADALGKKADKQDKAADKDDKTSDDDDDDTDAADKKDDDSADSNTDVDSQEEMMVTGFFGALSEKLGWSTDAETAAPKTAEELVDYFAKVIEEDSTPQYASDEVAKLDQFVKDGGDIRSYFAIDNELDLDTIEIADDENNQRIVVREFLKEKGFSAASIEKKLTKYADAGLLEDEAEDALEALVEIKAAQKELLLTDQQNAAKELKASQQAFVQSVVTEIKNLDNIRGIKVPEKDKKVLLDYIFKSGTDGKTLYAKDYAKSRKNLLESAYFTMKGDTLLNVAKNEGKKDAINSFKNSLKTNTGINKQSKKEIKNDDSNSIWTSLARLLRAVE